MVWRREISRKRQESEGKKRILIIRILSISILNVRRTTRNRKCQERKTWPRIQKFELGCIMATFYWIHLGDIYWLRAADYVAPKYDYRCSDHATFRHVALTYWFLLKCRHLKKTVNTEGSFLGMILSAYKLMQNSSSIVIPLSLEVSLTSRD